MSVVLSNNATSLLAGAITAANTTLSIENADASKFPAPAAGDWFPITIVDNAGNMEIMKATKREGSILTVTRAQEGTTAKAFAAGARVDVRLTAGAIKDLVTTQTVGYAVAGANSKTTPADGDFFTGVEAGGSTMFKSTWGNIKAALQSLFDNRYLRFIGGTLTGPLALLYPRSNAAVGDRNYTPAYIGRIGDANLEVTLFGEERVGTDVRAVISARSGSVISYFAFTHMGDLEVSRTVHCSDIRASGWLYSGTATFRTDGNIFGSKWNDRFGNWDAGEGIYNRIESRIGNCVTDTRYTGFIEQIVTLGQVNSDTLSTSGYVLTAIIRRTSNGNAYAMYFQARQPQVYINGAWRPIGTW